MNYKKQKLFMAVLCLSLLCILPSCVGNVDPVKEEFTVTYTTDHGTAPEKLIVEDGTILTSENLPELSETGYVFGGWYDYVIKVQADEYKVTKDVTLTAKWTPNKYKITFTAEGLKGSMDTIEYDFGSDAVKLPKFSFTLEEGCVFDYWEDENKQQYKDESIFTKIPKDTTLKAVWHKSNKYKIKFMDYKEQLEDGDEVEFFDSDDITLIFLKNTEEYEFIGWSESKDETGKIITGWSAFECGKDITLYAKWKKAVYSVIFGDAGSLKDIEAGDIIEIKEPDSSFIIPDGKQFYAWKITDTEGNTEYYYPGDKLRVWQNLTFEPEYIGEDEYPIVYHNATGSVNQLKVSIPKKMSGKVKLGDFVYFDSDDFDFEGLFYDENFTKEIIDGEVNYLDLEIKDNAYHVYVKAKVSINAKITIDSPELTITQKEGKDGEIIFTIEDEFKYYRWSIGSLLHDMFVSDKKVYKFQTKGLPKGTYMFVAMATDNENDLYMITATATIYIEIE